MKIEDYRDFNVECGRKICRIRTERQYSREYLAQLAGISSKFLYEIEIGKKGCSSYVICRLAEALDVSVDCLLDDSAGDSDNIEDLCRHFHGSQKESLTLIIQLMYEMLHNVS
ncbi:MAG: helix-turn-helix domain-containing protein [Lachnospiraceae bacterium]|nr:helix-turn-helix domain-containing protein [Lachnospiraceae bacterium]